MPNTENTFFCFLDESGDHSLDTIDPDYPVFVLAAVFIPVSRYYEELCIQVNKLKYSYFYHEGIILHSRDIRKSLPPFNQIPKPKTKENFLKDLTSMVDRCFFEVVICVIKKDKLKTIYGSSAFNPYHYAVKIILERLAYSIRERRISKVILLAERRGKKEDENLELEILRILKGGSERLPASDFSSIQSPIFISKENNVIGLQVADIVAHPAGRYVIDPSGQNRPFHVVRKKFMNDSEKYNFVILP